MEVILGCAVAVAQIVSKQNTNKAEQQRMDRCVCVVTEYLTEKRGPNETMSASSCPALKIPHSTMEDRLNSPDVL